MTDWNARAHGAALAQAAEVRHALSNTRDMGLDATLFLEKNDSTRFFAALDALIVTEPTHTNVNDFRAILIDPEAGGRRSTCS